MKKHRVSREISSEFSLKMKRIILQITLVLITIIMISCASKPGSFVQTFEPGWTSVELREGLDYNQAWQEVVDVLAKRFELEMIAKDGGYARTSWTYTWWKAGQRTENYRVRSIIKFSPNEERVDIKTEANYLDDDQWKVGYDTRLLETVKTDIMGVVGRTTR